MMNSGRRFAIVFLMAALFMGFSGWPRSGQTQEKDFEDFDAKNFSRPTDVNNIWLPLKPGTRLLFVGTTIEDGEALPHRVQFTVTDLTKVINGVRAVVCWDQDFSEDELVETEIIFFAQDDDGNVWHLGEYPEEYEDGKFVDAPCWIAGVGDGKAGIMMQADPKLGMPSYSEGWSPSVEWTDRGIVDQMGLKIKVPAGSYEDVLVIAEYSKTEPNAFQLKYYARGVGNIRVGWRGEDATKEDLELVKIEQLAPKALSEARDEALKLEKRAYKISKEVYAHTSSMEHKPAVKSP